MGQQEILTNLGTDTDEFSFLLNIARFHEIKLTSRGTQQKPRTVKFWNDTNAAKDNKLTTAFAAAYGALFTINAHAEAGPMETRDRGPLLHERFGG